jgi:hypothetical protein
MRCTTFFAALASASVIAALATPREVEERAATFDLRLWSGTGYTGGEAEIYDAGATLLPWRAKSYNFIKYGNCCVSFCNGVIRTGYRCASDSNNNVASANQVSILLLPYSNHRFIRADHGCIC